MKCGWSKVCAADEGSNLYRGHVYNPRWEKVFKNNFTVMELPLREELLSYGHIFSYNSVKYMYIQ